MAQIRWTPQAADDLEAIAEFIAQDSNQYARLFVIDALAAIEKLEQFPMLGRIVPEVRNKTIREIILGNYRIVYRHIGDQIELLTVYHGARLLDPKTLK